MDKKILHILCVAYKRPIGIMNICCQFLVQTNPNWELTVMYDGPIPQYIQNIMGLFGDKRIQFKNSKNRKGKWGHPNRKTMIEELSCDKNDLVLLTNEDNMYVPIFVDAILGVMTKKSGMIMCNLLHSYKDFKVMEVKLKENYIDLGCFAVRSVIAKSIGFNFRHISADGRYAEECALYCKENNLEILHIKEPLFIHC